MLLCLLFSQEDKTKLKEEKSNVQNGRKEYMVKWMEIRKTGVLKVKLGTYAKQK